MYILKETTLENMLRNAPDSCLVNIQLQGNEQYIRWEEEGKEFTFKGQLFDVVRIAVVNGQTIYRCVDDEHEDALLKKINDNTGNNHPPAGKAGGIPGVKLVYRACVEQAACNVPELLLPGPFYPPYCAALRQQAGAITVPPPRCAVFHLLTVFTYCR